MSRVEVITCDRCERRITDLERDEPPILGSLTVRVGDRVSSRDLCVMCADALLTEFMSGRQVSAPSTQRTLPDELGEAARRTANHGLERYAEGASAHELAGHLRDVVTHARR